MFSKTITGTCQFCDHVIKLKTHFLFDHEAHLIMNLMVVPHFLKYHRDKISSKRIWTLMKSILFLAVDLPIHFLFILIWLVFLPAYKFLSLFYD